MEGIDNDDDLEFVKASAGLLAELETELPKLLWKPPRADDRSKRVHTRVKNNDLDRVIQLIEPFQGEPQLLDARLKSILPPIVDAYLAYLLRPKTIATEHLDLEVAACFLLYTLCKVRGHKIIVTFLSNEPRYLEPILEALERTVISSENQEPQWQVPYILLLWLSHLLLTPFDLYSISTAPGPDLHVGGVDANIPELPALTSRILRIGIYYLTSPTKAQDSAAAMLVRLSIRPDVHKRRVADYLVKARLPMLQENASATRNMYEMLGSLRLVAGVASSAELGHLVPKIYEACLKALDDSDESSLSSNAVAKKLAVKIFRNIALLCLRSSTAEGVLLEFLQTNDVLESAVDYLLRSLGDKDTQVRYAAAKALSLIILELEPSIGHEVIQAILDSFKEDMPQSASNLEFSTVDPLKWHGLTLALSHTLFKRSASPEQLTEIFETLISALQFHQRTATGSNLGTNVRDAANFGLWSLSRRYTTAELLSISSVRLGRSDCINSDASIIEVLAVQLIHSASLDPAGNIRRGSSAALQELIGRHPDQVSKGISLVQIVDYQAVSLRTRAMVDVANNAAALQSSYWLTTLDALFGWRGLGSADVLSREAAATSLAQLAASSPTEYKEDALLRVTLELRSHAATEVEYLHGVTLAAALIIAHNTRMSPGTLSDGMANLISSASPWLTLVKEFSRRKLQSEVLVSIAKLLTALCNALSTDSARDSAIRLYDKEELQSFDDAADRLLTWYEDRILDVIPNMAQALLHLKRSRGLPLACIEAQTLSRRVAVDGSKHTYHSAGRALALGTLAPLFESAGINSEKALDSMTTLSELLSVTNVEWRVVSAKALLLAVDGGSTAKIIETQIVEVVCTSIHRGLNDYTIDERGDVGSLVRLQCISCASKVMSTEAFLMHENYIQALQGDILRLSLEKLDRVRLKAAQCRKEFLGLDVGVNDVASVSSPEYFDAALSLLTVDSPAWMHKALMEGCISCAGISAEPLLQASRRVLALRLHSLEDDHLERLLTVFASIMKEMLVETANNQAVLELLAFLLDMQIPQRLSRSTTFKWRNLLSTVQKLHHKSNDIPKILAAVHVYIGLAVVLVIRNEVLKKLVGMLKTNPYPRVRSAVAEALWMVTQCEMLKDCDWTKPVAQNVKVVEDLQRKYT